jgi:hypothetical protein
MHLNALTWDQAALFALGVIAGWITERLLPHRKG